MRNAPFRGTWASCRRRGGARIVRALEVSHGEGSSKGK
jgi:hypothetical protein